MPNVKANGMQVEYDTIGDPSAPPLLLIMGLGGQLIHWDEGFCRQLAGKGLFIIRYDHRDTGLSTKYKMAESADMGDLLDAFMQGQSVQPPYALNDMADDAAELLEALHIKKAHVCGASMGGMIAQILAIRHPQRLLSLISIYSTTGNPDLPQPEPRAMEALMTPQPTDRRAYIEFNVKTHRVMAGSGYPFDEEFIRNISAESYDRAHYPQGVGRQMLAVMTQENRKAALLSVTVPTLVIHGTADPLVPAAHGRDTADAVPGAQLLLVEGMGHDLPRKNGPWPQVIDAIAEHTKQAASGINLISG
ncbi:MAG: alpha/beta hydrolase [bacterium]|nr:alpha/beta hydrolase [bacterium]